MKKNFRFEIRTAILTVALLAVLSYAHKDERVNSYLFAAVVLITVTRQPDKKDYGINEPFDITGMEVTALNDDSSTLIITDYSLSYDFSTAGRNKPVTISYESKTTAVSVNVLTLAERIRAAQGTEAVIWIYADEPLAPNSFAEKNTIRRGTRLTLSGVETGAAIRLASKGRLFTIARGASLTISEFLEIDGNPEEENDSPLIVVDGGAFILDTFKGISGNHFSLEGYSQGGAVQVINQGSFIMQKGNICGNLAYYGGGVYVGYDSVFSMKSGMISNNGAYSFGEDVFVDSWSEDFGTLQLSGDACIGNLTLMSGSCESRGAVNIIGKFTGSVCTLDLLGSCSMMADVKDWWVNRQVIIPAAGVNSDIDKFPLGFFFCNDPNGPEETEEPITPDYRLNNSGYLIASEEEFVHVTDLVTSPGLFMFKGDKLLPPAVVLPYNATNKTVKWSSYDTAIATVDADTGEVTAQNTGETNLKATTDDGGISALCSVAVAPKDDYPHSRSTVSSIAVTEQPLKKDYGVNEPFDTAGLVVTAMYNDNTSAAVSINAGNLAYDFSTPGKDITVYVLYEGHLAAIAGINVLTLGERIRAVQGTEAEIILYADEILTQNSFAFDNILTDNTCLTLRGSGEERRIIRSTPYYYSLFQLFYGDAVRLTLEENLTLDGGGMMSGNPCPLINVNGGCLAMKSGAKITGCSGGTINVTDGAFVMDGGTITGNTAAQGGGVCVCNAGSFTMNGGSITGNEAMYNGNDVFLSGVFYLSGNAQIGNLALDNVSDAVKNVIITLAPFTGSVTSLDLGGYGTLDTVISQWANRQVIDIEFMAKPALDVSKFTLGKFYTHYDFQTAPVSPKYKLDNTGKLVVSLSIINPPSRIIPVTGVSVSPARLLLTTLRRLVWTVEMAREIRISDALLKAGQMINRSHTLTATVQPDNATNKTVSWSSDNPKVASVDDNTGAVTAQSAGSAIITATTKDGGKTAVCIVIVR